MQGQKAFQCKTDGTFSASTVEMKRGSYDGICPQPPQSMVVLSIFAVVVVMIGRKIYNFFLASAAWLSLRCFLLL